MSTSLTNALVEEWIPRFITKTVSKRNPFASSKRLSPHLRIASPSRGTQLYCFDAVHDMTTKLFTELGLSEELLKAIDKLGFEQAAPIQAAAIPLLMAGKDIVGQSQTGSGKTAAFGIPAVEKVDTARRAVQVLVLCPTRELAIQDRKSVV